MMSSTRSAVSLVILLVVIGGSVVATAQEAETSPPSPKGEDLFQRSADFLSSQKRLAVEIDLDLEITLDGETTSNPLSYKIVAERPNKMYLTLRPGSEEIVTVCDGTSAIVYRQDKGKYAKEDAPDGLSALLAQFGPGPAQAATILVAEAFNAPSFSWLLDTLKNQEYIGQETVDETVCDRVRIVTELFSWDMWIATGDKPVIIKMIPDTDALYSEMPSGTVKAPLRFKNWDFEPEVGENTFTFVPPDDATEVSSFAAVSGETNLDANPLEGKPAPVFTAELLNGESVNMADHFGKDIVVLDFWATWCGPCRRAMPELEEAVKKYKDKGVVVYAVNSSDSKDAIEEFLKEQGLDVTVAMDPTDRAFSAYLVEGIPQLVLIGRDGRVEKVITGYVDGYKELVSGYLETLVAGEHITEPAGEK